MKMNCTINIILLFKYPKLLSAIDNVKPKFKFNSTNNINCLWNYLIIYNSLTLSLYITYLII